MGKSFFDHNCFVPKSFGGSNIISFMTGYMGFDFTDQAESDKKPSVNFALTDYLALGSDKRMRQWKINGVRDSFGANVSSELEYKKAEECLSLIFESPVLLFPNSARVHIEAMPIVIHEDDAIILDHYVHSNLQIAAGLLKNRGNNMETIPHNNTQLLEERINVLKTNYKKVWYLTDSIYSALGNEIPVTEIQVLLGKYEQFNVYIDDSKGLSWTGKNGSGHARKHFHNHPHVLISASLSKGFGCEGGIMVCHSEEIKSRLLQYKESPLYESFMKPAILTAIVESAQIHLSDEIYIKQSKLEERIALFYATAIGFGLPVVSLPHTPVAFFRMGKPGMSQEICFNLMEKGFYLSGANFPIVPHNDSGIMANITLHQSKHDVREMLIAFRDEYDKALKKRKLSASGVRRQFEAKSQFV